MSQNRQITNSLQLLLVHWFCWRSTILLGFSEMFMQKNILPPTESGCLSTHTYVRSVRWHTPEHVKASGNSVLQEKPKWLECGLYNVKGNISLYIYIFKSYIFRQRDFSYIYIYKDKYIYIYIFVSNHQHCQLPATPCCPLVLLKNRRSPGAQWNVHLYLYMYIIVNQRDAYVCVSAQNLHGLHIKKKCVRSSRHTCRKTFYI